MKKTSPIGVNEKCPWHMPRSLGYMAFFEDAEKRTAKGQEQKQCPDCLYWFWPDQFGRKVARPPLAMSAK